MDRSQPPHYATMSRVQVNNVTTKLTKHCFIIELILRSTLGLLRLTRQQTEEVRGRTSSTLRSLRCTASALVLRKKCWATAKKLQEIVLARKCWRLGLVREVTHRRTSLQGWIFPKGNKRWQRGLISSYHYPSMCPIKDPPDPTATTSL